MQTTFHLSPAASATTVTASPPQAWFDAEAEVFRTEQPAGLLRGARRIATGVVIDRECVPPSGFEMPRLIRVVEIFDENFARELEALWEIRARRGRGPELAATGWRAEAVLVDCGDGHRATCLLWPPFLAFECPKQDTEFLLEELAMG